MNECSPFGDFLITEPSSAGLQELTSSSAGLQGAHLPWAVHRTYWAGLSLCFLLSCRFLFCTRNWTGCSVWYLLFCRFLFCRGNWTGFAVWYLLFRRFLLWVGWRGSKTEFPIVNF